MDKKIMKYSLLFIIILIVFNGCSLDLSKLTFKGEKPSNSYYTFKLKEDFSRTEKYNVNSIYMNFYKGEELTEDEVLITRKFLKYLEPTNFIEKPKDLPKRPEYKIHFTFDNSKYVINVYNSRYLSVYPWDGHYDVDYIDMRGTYEAYNLFGLCKYITKSDE